jgi:2,4-didehydro-3-deoxy-L-rhamnonate hydrolase
LRAPVPKPGKIIAVGFNYREHQTESGMKPASEPALFAKYANAVIGPDEVIKVPAATNEPDYEAELAVVMGRTASKVDARDALDYVGGYTCCNDVTARDLIRSNAQWQRGKAIDTFLPCGP